MTRTDKVYKSAEEFGEVIDLDIGEYLSVILQGGRVHKYRSDDGEMNTHDRYGDDSYTQGFMAEKMACKYYGSEFDDRVITTEEKEDSGTPSYDTVVNGIRVDVKSTQYYHDPWLRVYPHEIKDDVDVFVAVGLSVPDDKYPNKRGIVAGWSTKDHVENRELVIWRNKPIYKLGWKQLNRPHTLMEESIIDRI